MINKSFAIFVEYESRRRGCILRRIMLCCDVLQMAVVCGMYMYKFKCEVNKYELISTR